MNETILLIKKQYSSYPPSSQHKTSIQINLKECKCNAYACPLPSYPTRYEATSYPSLGNVRYCTGMVVTIVNDIIHKSTPE